MAGSKIGTVGDGQINKADSQLEPLKRDVPEEGKANSSCNSLSRIRVRP